MGGVLIIGAVTVSTLLWAVPGNVFVLLTLATLVVMGAIGFEDDYRKLRRRSARGLSARSKLALQAAWAAAAAVILLALPATREYVRQLMVPFVKDPVVRDLGIVATILFVSLVVVGASNAVNLTDGLDGLAIGCTASAALSYFVMAYVAGHARFAEYLRVPHVDGTAELAVFCACLLGGSLGFLWFNCHPAQVFMGDTGSLALGGAIAMVAVLIRQELTLVIVGGVFVMEALSVILQVASFRLRGKRVFAMAPIHHHFELRKWSETQVTIRFWILSILCALLGVATLKIR
jgi:phospho-N-acetylmuramoyl-pentapeptide-transferase